MIYNLINRLRASRLPRASEVLNAYLVQESYPHWTSFYVKYKDVINDQYNLTCFINKLDDENKYLILRTGCFPFIKYHCTKLKRGDDVNEDQVVFQNKFFNLIKLFNLGIPTLAYGIGGYLLYTHTEIVRTSQGDVTIYFLIKENKQSEY